MQNRSSGMGSLSKFTLGNKDLFKNSIVLGAPLKKHNFLGPQTVSL